MGEGLPVFHAKFQGCIFPWNVQTCCKVYLCASPVLGKVVLNTVTPLLFFTVLMMFKELLQLRALRGLSVLIPVSSVGSGWFYSQALHFRGTSDRSRNVRRKDRLLLSVCRKLVRKIS